MTPIRITSVTTPRPSARRWRTLGLAAGLMLAQALSWADAVRVYGPGGPAPAMKAAAEAYGRQAQVAVEVVAGPTPKWAAQAKTDADVIFSGAEHMMSDFAQGLPGLFDLKDVQPLYLRPVAILVRPGNPKGIRGFADLLQPGVRVLAVAGAGQTGLWEDVAGRRGRIQDVRALRANLVLPEAPNSAAARERWQSEADIDAWLIWNIWQISNPKLADLVPVEEPYRIYRDTGVVLTQRGKTSAHAQGFVRFLASPEGARIFAQWGWQADAAPALTKPAEP